MATYGKTRPPFLRRARPGGDDPSTGALHALGHGVAAGLLEAAGERSRALDGERANRAGPGREQVSWSDSVKRNIR